MHAHLDPFCGASGDMLLGALVDAGVPVAALQVALDALGLPALRLSAERVDQRGIAATRALVAAPREHRHRHLPDIEALLARSTLPADLSEPATAVFRALAEAEAAVHGVPVDQVHFHEVGALDAIADVVGVLAGLQHLGVTSLSCRAVPLSHGTVRCEHGLLPVPAPAVLRLAEGLPTCPLDLDGETVTPTAAALLRILVTHWQDAPPMVIRAQGYGAGTRTFPRANVLRLVLGERAAAPATDLLSQLDSNIDDMNPEWLPAVLERLLAAGALDAWLTPVLMKKGRPAHTLSVLAEADSVAALREVIFAHTTSLGIRETRLTRHRLPRESVTADTAWGPVMLKVATLPDGTRRAAPEYEDCRRISEARAVPLQTVYEAALAAWRTGGQGELSKDG